MLKQPRGLPAEDEAQAEMSGVAHKIRSSFARLAGKVGRRLVGSRTSRHAPDWVKRLFTNLVGYADVHTIHGFKMSIPAAYGAWDSRSFFYSVYEPEVTRLLMRELKPGMVFLDIGAHFGYLSLLAARLVGSQGRVVAFEPAPESAAILQHNVALNGFDQVQVVEKGVSDRSGRERFIILNESGLGLDYTLHDSLAELAHHVVEVETVSLDDFVPTPGSAKIDWMKIDVEGAEEAVLKEMRNLLSSRHPP